MRECMEVSITSDQPDLVKALSKHVGEFGYNITSNIVHRCVDYDFRIGKDILGKIEDADIVRELLLPFSFREIAFMDWGDDMRMEVRLGSPQAPVAKEIEIIGLREVYEQVQTRSEQFALATHYVETSGEQDAELQFRNCDLYNAGLLAWKLGMPPETKLVLNPALHCQAQARFASKDQLTRLCRANGEWISVRCSDAVFGREYADHLESLGYHIHYLFIEKEAHMYAPEYRRFGAILSFHSRIISLPSFRQKLKDLSVVSASWLRERNLDLQDYPFDLMLSTRPNITRSILVDLPWKEMKNGEFPLYGSRPERRFEPKDRNV